MPRAKTVTSIVADIAAEPPLDPAVSPDALTPLYVGIDIAKNAHVAGFVSASLIVKHGRHEKCPTLVFENSRTGFEQLAAAICARCGACSNATVLLESTGVYGAALEQYLLEQNVTVYMMHVRARPETHRKTDKYDALSLANQIYNTIARGIQIDDKARKVRLVTPPTATSQRLKGLVQRRYEIGIEVTRSKNKLTAIADELFPELVQVYKNVNGPGALHLREKFPTPEAIAKASLSDLYATRARNRPSNAQLAQLQVLARQTIGVKNVDRLFSLTTEQSQLIKALQLLEEHQADLDEKIESLVSTSREGKILTSISGVGTNCAATTIATMGNIANFESAAKLRSFFGWAPEVEQTGISLDRQFQSMSGSRLMKKALYLGVIGAIRHDTPWKALYDRLVPRMCTFDERTQKWRGKMKVIGRIAGQMCGMIYMLLKMDADLLASIPAGTEPPSPELYDEARHLRALTKPLSKGSPGPKVRENNKRNSVSASFKRFELPGFFPTGHALILNAEQWTLTLLAHGEICKQVTWSRRECDLMEQVLQAWPDPCLNEALLAAYSSMGINQARDLVLTATRRDTLEALMHHPEITLWRCREKLVEAFGLDIEKQPEGFQLKGLSSPDPASVTMLDEAAADGGTAQTPVSPGRLQDDRPHKKEKRVTFRFTAEMIRFLDTLPESITKTQFIEDLVLGSSDYGAWLKEEKRVAPSGEEVQALW